MPGLGTSYGRGGATVWLPDLANADCILIQGSNFAENHPVGFRFVMEAKERGATIIHVDPRFTRTSAMADIYAPLRSGTDIVFLGALINYVLRNDCYFKEYVAAYTNAAHLLNENYQDAEELDAELASTLVNFVGAHLQLKNTLENAKADMDAAAKVAQAEARAKTKTPITLFSRKSGTARFAR